MPGALAVTLLFFVIMAVICFPEFSRKKGATRVVCFISFALSFAVLIFRSFDTKITDPAMKIVELWGFLFYRP